MMLKALIAYADREKLHDPDFELGEVQWVVPLDSNGRLEVGPIDLRENPKRMRLPYLEQKQLTDARRPRTKFLADALERSVGFVDPKKPERAKRCKGSLDFFVALLEEAIQARSECKQDLGAVVRFLRDEKQRKTLCSRLVEAKAKTNEIATFRVAGRLIADLEAARMFWVDWRKRRSQSSTSVVRVCIATGELAETLDTTDKIFGVPAGLPQGTNLISFDKESFCSFGLEKAQNAALSAPAELKIRSALNALIEKSRTDKLVFNNTIHLHWTRKPIPYDPFDLLANADENAVATLLRSHRTGVPPVTFDANDYYALGLSGNGARVVVRDWLQSTVPEVEHHVAKWFRDLSIILPDGVGVRRNFSLGKLLWTMANPKMEKPFDALPQGAASQLPRSALTGFRLPETILAALLRREAIDRVSRDEKTGKAKPFLPARFALIKACLLRSPNLTTINKQPSTTPMTECLNPESRDPAYLCGRLFAVFAELQSAALQNVGAGIVERYYASASVTPALVMGRLFRNAQFHNAKAESEGGWKKGKAINAAKDFEAITCALGDEFPATLDLEAQGRFALGYYHQKAEYRRRTAERKEKETAEAGK